MSLVYLDNSHLNLLEQTLRDSPAQFSEFTSGWRKAGHTLAISTTHADEIVLSSHPDARERRYDVIRALLPVRTNLPLPEAPLLHHAPLIHREIACAIASRTGTTHVLQQSDRYWVAFPSLATKQSLTLSSLVLEHPAVRDLVCSAHLAHDTCASAKRREPAQKHRRLRLRDLANGPLTDDEARSGLEEFDRGFWNEKDHFARKCKLSPDLLENAWRQQRQAMVDFLARMQEVGHRRAYAERLGVDPDAAGDEYVDILMANEVLQRLVPKCARDYLGLSAEASKAIHPTIVLEDCPGYWLRHNVGQEIMCAEEASPVSSEYDLEHLAHLPYTDLFLCDKRIANYVRQLRRRQPHLGLWRTIRPPLSIASTLEALQRAAGGGSVEW